MSQSIRAPSHKRTGVLYVSFNQDVSCISLGTATGVSVFSLDSHRCIYHYPVGAISIAEMLFRTSLMAYVGAGHQPALTPRKVSVLNTSSGTTIQDLSCPTAVLAVHMNRKRLVVCLDGSAHVYALNSLALLQSLETPRGSGGPAGTGGLAALTACDEPCLLALPSGDGSSGALRVYDLLAPSGDVGGGQGCVLCEIAAHKAPLAALAWSADGRLLASASTQGTVVRVHRLPSATKAFTFRRGMLPATIHSLSFTPSGLEPPLLAAVSSHSTVHVWRVSADAPGCGGPAEANGGLAEGGVAAAASGLLTTIIRVPTVSDVVDPPRALASVKLPCENVAATCALLPTRERATPAPSTADGTYDPDEVLLLVATLDGLLYEYRLEELHAPAGPRCSLEGEWAMLGSSGSGGGAL